MMAHNLNVGHCIKVLEREIAVSTSNSFMDFWKLK